MNKIMLLIAVFSLGYMVNDLAEEMNIEWVGTVNAEVAGMDYYGLKRDRDFKRAVRYIVEDCSVSDGSILNDELSDSSLSC